MIKLLSRQLRKKIIRNRLEKLIIEHKSDELTLDIGCGDSRYHEYFPNRVGIDYTYGRGVDIIADAHHLPIRSESVQVVFSTEMLEHTYDPQKVVNEMARVLKSNGRIVLTTRFVFPIHEAPHDYFRFTKYGLRHLFRNWQQIEVTQDTTSFESLASLFQRLTYQMDFMGGKLLPMLWLLIAWILRYGGALAKVQYGSYQRDVVEDEILPSGYIVVAQKGESELV